MFARIKMWTGFIFFAALMICLTMLQSMRRRVEAAEGRSREAALQLEQSRKQMEKYLAAIRRGQAMREEAEKEIKDGSRKYFEK